MLDKKSEAKKSQPIEPLWKVFFYAVSFFMFPVGILLGAFYYSQADPYEKKLGETCLTISVVMFLLSGLLFVSIVGIVLFAILSGIAKGG